MRYRVASRRGSKFSVPLFLLLPLTSLRQKKKQTLLHLFVCVLLLGIAELSTALEDPFTGGHLPLEDMARTTVRDVARARREASQLRALEVGGEGGSGGGGGAKDGGEASSSSNGSSGSSLPILETVDWSGAEAMCGKVES